MSKARDGWELSKENIQPLSCGRRMADLADALPTRADTVLSDQQQYEEHHLREIEKLEQLAKQKTGDDPLQDWVNLLKYFQQHFPNMPHNIKGKYSHLLRLGLREFYGNIKYSNDTRYINILIASVKNLPAAHQIKCLTEFLRDSKGDTVCDMYIRLAELFDEQGDTKNASEILRKGIQKNAQPKGKLEEMLTYIQEVWGKNYAKSLKNDAPNGTEQDSQSDVRNFAASVPIYGENNEAISIRRNLQPAAPANTSKAATNIRQSTIPQKLSVFNEENVSSQSTLSNNNPVETRPDPKRLDVLDNVESDRENRLDACRWNSKHTQLENPVIPEPPKKLKLYQEESELPSAPSIDKSKTINKRALKEKKEESELSEAEMVSSLQPAVVNDVRNEKVVETSFKEKNLDFPKKEGESVAKSFIWRRNYRANMGKNNFFENIKYKPLPSGRVVSRIMLRSEHYFEEREKEMKKKENDAVMKLRLEIDELTNKNKNLLFEMKQLETTMSNTTKILEERLEKQKSDFELTLFEKDQKVCSLESQYEDLMSQLTRMTTNNNVRESQYERLQYENQQLKQEMEDFQKKFEEEKQLLVQEIQLYKRRNEALAQESVMKRIKIKQEPLDEECVETDMSIVGKKKSFVDIHVCSRTAEVFSSPSIDQGTDEASIFQSAETTIERQQSVAASSFMPDLNMDEDKSMFINSVTQTRKALGMVERPLENDMMNMTPATAPPMDFEGFPAPSFGGDLFKPSKRGFEIYESFCNNTTTSKPAREDSSLTGFGNKRVDIVKFLQNLPENMAPTSSAQTAVVASKSRSDDNSQFLPTEVLAGNKRTEDHFRRPAPPSDENAIPTTLQKPRRSILLARRQDDSSDEEDDIILRRHQQTGVDLNISNLTTMLALGPKPLVNSTPERERTLRDLPPIAPRTLVQQGTDDEPPVSESHVVRASRFSILNEPPLNLSTIQETSRENRSRSTTGSSSGNTMSSTRLGAVSGYTQLYGNITSRSSSVPRSASRISQQNNNNGYYSDTNAMQ